MLTFAFKNLGLQLWLPTSKIKTLTRTWSIFQIIKFCRGHGQLVSIKDASFCRNWKTMHFITNVITHASLHCVYLVSWACFCEIINDKVWRKFYCLTIYVSSRVCEIPLLKVVCIGKSKLVFISSYFGNVIFLKPRFDRNHELGSSVSAKWQY